MSCLGGLAMAGSSIYGANLQSDAEKQALGFQESAFNTVQKDLSPFMTAGSSAIPGLMNLLGIGPGGSAGALKALQATPGYQFALDNGMKATQNGFAAQGLGSSGAAMKGAANYAEGLASTTYQQQVGNYMNLLGVGESAAAGIGAGAQTAAQGESNAVVGGANAMAGGINNAMGYMTGFGSGAGMYGGGSSNSGGMSSFLTSLFG